MKTLDNVLAEHPFFQGLEPEYLQLMRGCASNASYGAGAYIFREGDPATHFYVVRRGRVALEISAAHLGIITIETIDAGEVLGWSWLFAPYRWHLSARG
jgi:CRP/FNR family transcriptional regulator, cyclic AMP receptor protein